MRAILYIFIISSVFSFRFKAEKGFPIVKEGYFTSPVKHAIKLGGNFCELRNNHFHAGIDIKSSKGIIGDSIFAVAPGYLRRVEIQRGSYGQTIYIDHPVGLTSVYAHLDAFEPGIQKWIRQLQKKDESFEIDAYPDSSQFKIIRGQFIGIMGNRGHSFGPHLHFEIRTKVTEIPLNPMDYGISSSDNRPPVYTKIKVSGIDHTGVPQLSSNYTCIKISKGKYRLKSDTILVSSWRAGVSLGVFDRQDGSWNKNGTYSIILSSNDDTLYQFKASHCSFDETHQINAHIDYEERISYNSFLHRCYILPGNTLSFYPKVKDAGYIKLFQNKAQHIRIISEDHAGNKTELEFWIKRIATKTMEDNKTFHTLFSHDKANSYTFGNIGLNSSQGALYYDIGLIINPTTNELGYLEEIEIGHAKDAIKSPLELSIPTSYFPFKNKNKIHLEYFDERKSIWKSIGGIVNENNFIFHLSYLGKFRTSIDTIPPVIKAIHCPQYIQEGEILKFKIKDQTISNSRKDQIKIKTTLDGNWILAEFDAKSNSLHILVEELATKGEHILVIESIDFRQNKSTIERTLILN